MKSIVLGKIMGSSPRAITPGMFSWAGTGPAGTTCYGCTNFHRAQKPRKPELEHRCAKWVEWFKGANGSYQAPRLRLNPQTPSCSAFTARQEKEDAPGERIVQEDHLKEHQD